MSLLDEFKNHEADFRKGLKTAGTYSFLASICMLAMPMFLFQVYDHVLAARSTETLIALFIFALVILGVYGLFDHTRQLLLSRAGMKLEKEMAGMILAGELSRQDTGTATSLRDLATLRQAASSPAFYALFDIPMIPVFIFLVFLIHPVLGFTVTLGAGVLFGLGFIAERKTSALNHSYMEATVKAHRALEMHLRSQEYIHAQGLYREAVLDWGRHQGEQMNRHGAAFEETSKYSSATKAFRQIIQISMIGVGALLVLNDQATAGVIFATSMIGSRALGPVEQIVGGWRQLKSAIEARKRLMTRLEDMDLPENRTKLPRPKGQLSIERVSYVPRPGMPPILRGVNATIEAGETVAIIGPSGAGKSTLARVLVGYLKPVAGKVSLDGQDLKVWDPVARGIHMGYVPQQVSFFDATVRENIARLRREDPEEWAIEAAKIAGVHEMILKLPQGYDTQIAAGVFMPSGGQSQLIALARAFYGNPSVLVLDEPNASLDNVGEAVFHKALQTAKKRGITTVVVSQRPSVLKFVDKVMLMGDGTIKDFGPKEKVMSQGLVKAVPSEGKKMQNKAKVQVDAGKAQPAPKDATKAADGADGANENVKKAAAGKDSESKNAPTQSGKMEA